MKPFVEFVREDARAAAALGRNVGAKMHYGKLLNTDPQKAKEFIDLILDRQKTYSSLLPLVKTLIQKYLGPDPSLTRGDGLARAYNAFADEVVKQFPKVKKSRVLAILRSESDDFASDILDSLYPELKKLNI